MAGPRLQYSQAGVRSVQLQLFVKDVAQRHGEPGNDIAQIQYVQQCSYRLQLPNHQRPQSPHTATVIEASLRLMSRHTLVQQQIGAELSSKQAGHWAASILVFENAKQSQRPICLLALAHHQLYAKVKNHSLSALNSGRKPAQDMKSPGSVKVRSKTASDSGDAKGIKLCMAVR